jgi:uncharacterized protein YjbI with pentapeptide repeats
MHSDERYVDTDFGDRSLASVSFVGCAFERVRLLGGDARGVQLAECMLTDLDAPVFTAPRSSWRSTQMHGSRIGSGEIYESTWRSVAVEGCKINYLNARSAHWTDAVFRDCVIDELDLAHATLTRVIIDRCRIGTLDVTDAKLTDVDLRGATLNSVNGLGGLAGAWITEAQLTEFAPLLAAHLGLHVATS